MIDHVNDRHTWGTGGPDTPGKSQVAISYLTNSGTDPAREAIAPQCPKFASRGGGGGGGGGGEVRAALCEMR